jgi:hypothetical protein
MWSQLPSTSHQLKWVKAHQDADCLYCDLPWNARLNVEADSLATAYYETAKSSRMKPLVDPAFFPSSQVSLLVNGQRVTASIPEAICFHVNGTNHRKYLQQTKPGWQHDDLWNLIDMECLGQAYKSLPTLQRNNVSKMLHGWTNTGSQREKINLASSSVCPRCGENQ